MKLKPTVKVTECRLFIIQWRYFRKWIPLEVYYSLPQAMEQFRERLLASPNDKVKRFRLVRNYHRQETRTINQTTVIR